PGPLSRQLAVWNRRPKGSIPQSNIQSSNARRARNAWPSANPFKPEGAAFHILRAGRRRGAHQCTAAHTGNSEGAYLGRTTVLPPDRRVAGTPSESCRSLCRGRTRLPHRLLSPCRRPCGGRCPVGRQYAALALLARRDRPVASAKGRLLEEHLWLDEPARWTSDLILRLREGRDFIRQTTRQAHRLRCQEHDFRR